MPLRTDPLYRAGAIRPDRVGNEIVALQSVAADGCMIDEGDAEIASGQLSRAVLSPGTEAIKSRQGPIRRCVIHLQGFAEA